MAGKKNSACMSSKSETVNSLSVKVAREKDCLFALGPVERGRNSPQGRLHSLVPVLTKSDKVTDHHNLLCKSPEEQVPDRGIASTYGQRCSRTDHTQTVLQLAFSGPQTQ